MNKILNNYQSWTVNFNATHSKVNQLLTKELLEQLEIIFKCSFGLIILYLLCILKDRSWFNNGLSGEYLLFYICTLFLLLFNLCLVVIHLYLQIFFIFTLIFLFILFRLKAFLKQTIVLIKALLIFFFLRLKLKRLIFNLR